MDISLHHKTAIVCGSTQGIGKATALLLASLGANIILVARNEEKLQETASQLDQQLGQSHSYLVADFTKSLDLKKKLDFFLEDFSKIDILINNTGGPAPGIAISANTEDFTEAFEQHLVCNQILAQAVVPLMKKSGYGRIINVLSTSVKQPIPGLGVSNTIRAAVASWSKTLAAELGPLGITVNNILPGFTETNRIKNLIASKVKESGQTTDEIRKQMEEEIPLRRFADPVETAQAIAFLASPAASYITGINLPVDGGKISCL